MGSLGEFQDMPKVRIFAKNLLKGLFVSQYPASVGYCRMMGAVENPVGLNKSIRL
jgi:hypothetical protein